MQQTKYKVCRVDGCTSKTYGKEYCHAHIKEHGRPAAITKEQRSLMRSDCCEGHCDDGERHEYGRQYCAKCKAACLWHPA